MSKFLYLDLETTGLDHKTDEIRQIACKAMINGKLEKLFSIKIKYNKAWRGHKKSDHIEWNNNAYRKQTAYDKFIAYLDKLVNKFDPNDKLVLKAYNAPFDDAFLREFFAQNHNKFYGSYFYNPPVCIMNKVMTYLTENGLRNQVQSMKLKDIATYFGVEVDEKRLHEAGYDVAVMIKVENKLNEKMYGMRAESKPRNN